ncbi:MAG: superoxide dismutase family protein [Bacteroidetes bacterium]|nr:superoxide dismutase family protein [Bacteroidota bacterium]
MLINKFFKGILLLAISLLLFSCAKNKEETKVESDDITKAICVLHPTAGNDVRGIITFTKTEYGIKIVADVEGLTEGKHGFHIHEFGDCSSGDGKSAGGHFNPAGVAHAGPDAEERHIGDLGNITADANGTAHADFVDSRLRIMGDYSIVGKGVILHADPDDMSSQPTGAAGARISCGVIKMKAEEMAEK